MTGKKSCLYHTTKLFVGQDRQPMHFIVDTGSSDFLIHGPSCQGCPGNPYLYDRSHSFHLSDFKVDMFSLNSDISGTDITDNIAMKADGKQIEAIEMLMLNKVTGSLSKVGEDGVIGFTPRRMRDLGKGNKFDSLTEKRHSPFLT